MKNLFKILVTSLAIYSAMPAQAAAPAPDFPSKPIQLIFPWSGGTVIDTFTRALAEGMSLRLKQSVIVVSKPGGNTILGAKYLLQAPADGYTLLIGSDGTYAINALRSDTPYDPTTDFTPVSHVATAPLFALVNNNSPIRNMKDLIAQAKEKPGQIAYGSTGVGSLASLAIEELAQQTGITLVHVPYKGSGEVVTALQGGFIQFAYNGGLANVKEGRARAIAVASGTRYPGAPEVPTVREAAGLPQYDESAWWAITAPKGTPDPVVKKLNAAINDTLSDPAFKARFAPMGFDAAPGTPQQLSEKIALSLTKWRAVIQQAGIALQ